MYLVQRMSLFSVDLFFVQQMVLLEGLCKIVTALGLTPWDSPVYVEPVI